MFFFNLPIVKGLFPRIWCPQTNDDSLWEAIKRQSPTKTGGAFGAKYTSLSCSSQSASFILASLSCPKKYFEMAKGKKW